MLARAYARRKKFEAQLIAEAVATTLLGPPDASANPSSPSPSTPRPSTASVAPSELLRTMGITL